MGRQPRQPSTFAELTVVPANQVRHKPLGLSFEEAAACVMSGLAALIAMRDVGQVGPGTEVLINGASGGVGTFAGTDRQGARRADHRRAQHAQPRRGALPGRR